jgi:hypothetical protein
MNEKHFDEARLERSLRHQIRAPKLDGRFDAAVWARIEMETVKAAVSGDPRVRGAASRWMFFSNVVGALVSVALVIYFGAQAFMGEGMSSLPVPDVSPGLVERIITSLTWPVTIAALCVGVMFTPLGRKLRAEFG